MMLNATLGDILRNARENKKMDIRMVSKETKIIAKYIEALEKNAFEVFPSETYLMGFLKNYGQFLHINEDELIRLYRAQLISESQTPIAELTKSTSPGSIISPNFGKILQSSYLPIVLKYAGLLGLGIVMIGIAYAAWNFFQNPSFTRVSEQDAIKLEQALTNSKKIILLNKKSETIIGMNEAFHFDLEEHKIQISLLKLGKDEITVGLFPDKLNVPLSMNVAKSIFLPSAKQNISLIYKAGTNNSAKIEVGLGEKIGGQEKTAELSTEHNTFNPGELTMRMELKINISSYVETYADGKKVYSGLLVSGRDAAWTAKRSMQLHLGNADGVQISINGVPYQFKGKVVNKIFAWSRNPLDPTKYQIVVKDQM